VRFRSLEPGPEAVFAFWNGKYDNCPLKKRENREKGAFLMDLYMEITLVLGIQKKMLESAGKILIYIFH